MSDHSAYEQEVKNHIEALTPIFAKAAVGDFSQDVPTPDHEDEFTSLQVGVQIMLDVIREKIKNYDAAARELKERYEEKNALLQSIGDGVVVLDNNGHVTFINHSGQSIVGWNEAEVVGKRWPEVTPLEKVDGTRIESSIRPVTVAFPPTTQDGSTETLYYVRKNGTRFAVSTTITKVMLEGRNIGSIVVFRDVSREKEVEELKEDFLSLATHQLRSPLVTMRWTLESLLETGKTEVPPALKKSLEIIYQNNQHMIGLVNDILSVSRISQGRLVEQKQPNEVLRLLENVLTQLKPSAEHKRMKFTVKLEDETLRDKKYLIDASLFSHCMENVIGNSVKYGKEGTEILITLATREGKVCLDVADQGVGIPEVDKTHMFEKFYRGQNVAQMDAPGSGLGLFVVKSIVDHWGGTITLDSKEDVGTKISVCIPFEVV